MTYDACTYRTWTKANIFKPKLYLFFLFFLIMQKNNDRNSIKSLKIYYPVQAVTLVLVMTYETKAFLIFYKINRFNWAKLSTINQPCIINGLLVFRSYVKLQFHMSLCFLCIVFSNIWLLKFRYFIKNSQFCLLSH